MLRQALREAARGTLTLACCCAELEVLDALVAAEPELLAAKVACVGTFGTVSLAREGP